MISLKTSYDPEEKLWRGPEKKRMFSDDMSVGEVALYMLRGKNPSDIMQICDPDGTVMTYGEALTSAIRIAQHFKKMQLTADDVVGIFAPNTMYVTPVAVAAWFNGTPFQATNYLLETSVVQHIYNLVQPKVIFCDGLYYEKVKTASQSFKPLIYTLCNHLENVPKVEDLLEPTVTEHFYLAQPLTYGPSQTVAILVSSGTTGLPKGVCVSNRACTIDFGFSNGSSTLFTASTLDWSSGLFTLIANVLVGGRRLLTTKPLTPEYLLELIVKYKVNFLASIPGNLVQLSLLPNYSQKTMQSVRLIFMSGAYCSEANQKRIRSALTMGVLIYGYGSTEFGGIAANLADYKSKSVGQVVHNVKVKIVDPASGERLGPNQIGEICVSHGSRWLGYYKNPEATEEMIDSENFIHTGDLGYMDEEHYLFITGRSKDVMKYKGYHYTPQDIEDIVLQMPDIIDACVFGVFDELSLDVPAAAVVKREGSSLTENEIMEYVRNKAEVPHKQLHYGVFFVEELPRNQNGKLLRNKIKEMCLAMEGKTEEK